MRGSRQKNNLFLFVNYVWSGNCKKTLPPISPLQLPPRSRLLHLILEILKSILLKNVAIIPQKQYTRMTIYRKINLHIIWFDILFIEEKIFYLIHIMDLQNNSNILLYKYDTYTHNLL